MQLSIGKPFFEVSDCVDRANDAIFVETVAPVCAAEERPVTVEFRLAALRSHGLAGIDGMLVLHALDNLVRVDAAIAVLIRDGLSRNRP